MQALAQSSTPSEPSAHAQGMLVFKSKPAPAKSGGYGLKILLGLGGAVLMLGAVYVVCPPLRFRVAVLRGQASDGFRKVWPVAVHVSRASGVRLASFVRSLPVAKARKSLKTFALLVFDRSRKLGASLWSRFSASKWGGKLLRANKTTDQPEFDFEAPLPSPAAEDGNP